MPISHPAPERPEHQVTPSPEQVPNRPPGSALERSLEFVVSIVLFFGLGWLVDAWLGTRPLFMVLGTLFAVVGNFVRMWALYDAEMKRHETTMRRRGALAGIQPQERRP